MKAKILVIGRNLEILQTVLRLCNGQPAYEALGAVTDKDAIDLFSKNDFDLVLIGGGVEETSEEKLSSYFRIKNKSIKIISHYGGGSGLLFNELRQALESKQ